MCIKFKLDIEKVVNFVKTNINKLNLNYISDNLLYSLTIEGYYDKKKLLLKNISKISKLNAYQFIIDLYDTNLLKNVKKSIINTNFFTNLQCHDKSIKVSIPPLSLSRRKSILKESSQILEKSKVSIRNIRRLSISRLKKEEKNGNISKNYFNQALKKINTITNNSVKSIEDIFLKKTKIILNI